jgi:hypothetical protein
VFLQCSERQIDFILEQRGRRRGRALERPPPIDERHAPPRCREGFGRHGARHARADHEDLRGPVGAQGRDREVGHGARLPVRQASPELALRRAHATLVRLTCSRSLMGHGPADTWHLVQCLSFAVIHPLLPDMEAMSGETLQT